MAVCIAATVHHHFITVHRSSTKQAHPAQHMPRHTPQHASHNAAHAGTRATCSHAHHSIHLSTASTASLTSPALHAHQEFYGDYVAVEPHHFIIPTARPELLLSPKASMLAGSGTDYELLDRFVQGLSALCLSIRRKPIIRCAGCSRRSCLLHA